MTGSYETLSYTKDGNIGRLELMRPERLNAVAMTGAHELHDIVQKIAADPDLRIVTFTGSGRAFSTGIDLKDLAAGEIEPLYFDLWDRALRIVETMDKLALCLVHGYAVGGGLQLALACDIRACTPTAKLGLPAIKEGLIPGLGTWRLARYIGLGRAKSLIIRGNMIDGTEAERIGMIDHIVQEETAKDEFEALVAEYAASNSEGCRQSKAMLLDCFDMGFDAFFEKYLLRQQRALDDPDFTEAMAAYNEKRQPKWR
jgi:enoyl-CoA hydratase/carnithine racemase